MTIWIGEVIGGPDAASSPFVAALREIKSRYGDDESSDSGVIDLVFHVPGSLVKPDYEGLRTGRFSKKEKTLMVQVAVPEEKVFGEDPRQFIQESINAAVDLARPRFEKAGIPFNHESSQE